MTHARYETSEVFAETLPQRSRKRTIKLESEDEAFRLEEKREACLKRRAQNREAAATSRRKRFATEAQKNQVIQTLEQTVSLQLEKIQALEKRINELEANSSSSEYSLFSSPVLTVNADPFQHLSDEFISEQLCDLKGEPDGMLFFPSIKQELFEDEYSPNLLHVTEPIEFDESLLKYLVAENFHAAPPPLPPFKFNSRLSLFSMLPVSQPPSPPPEREVSVLIAPPAFRPKPPGLVDS
jgi:hypothetical protein